MSSPLLHEFRKRASFFLKEKIKTARLALTDVTPAQLMTEEATNGNPWPPASPTLRLISRAAFELEEYWRIVEILHKRLLKFEKKDWRASYNSLILLDYLLTHGPESVAVEFQSDKDVINQMKGFQHIDDRRFNWGLTLQKKSERILMLLEDGPLLKGERERARKVTRGIQGFGSFSERSAPREASSSTPFGRCHSDFNNHHTVEFETMYSRDDLGEIGMLQNSDTSTKEDMAAGKKEESHLWNLKEESDPMINRGKGYSRLHMFMDEQEYDHPFNSTDMHVNASLLSAGDRILQRC
ncbi:epsin-2-like [Neltuma alba]|uniref:epsin-2-like n=1 Tax=Neltuma alba TaxID=207710 RepID=UPI0010A34BDC|nr:epsin-2-like [Prosopis alba]XP_028807314.1 epsin-2-like [Prosopis alba]